MDLNIFRAWVVVEKESFVLCSELWEDYCSSKLDLLYS